MRASCIQHLGDRDSPLVSLLAYSGLRPGEALALTLADIGTTHISVTKALSLGIVGRTKTGRTRRVPVLPCLREDLVAWKLRSGRSADADLVFPNHEGLPWSEPTRRQWGGRNLRPALAKAGLTGVRTYDLRHTNASLLIASGISIVEVARRLGHAPSMCLDTYAHVIEQYEGQPPIDIEQQIARARRAVSAA